MPSPSGANPSPDDLSKRVDQLEAAGSNNLVQIAVAVIGVLGTGIGVLTIVALFGGIKMLARFRGLGLPGTEGVATLPQSLLLSVGAEALLPALLVAVVAVLIVWFVPRRAPSEPNSRVRWIAAGEVLIAALAAALITAIVYILKEGFPETRGVGFVVLCAWAVVGGAAAWRAEQIGRRVLCLSLLFATILVVGALLTYWTTIGDPELRPAALAREGGRDLTGLWVARSGDWFYLAKADKREQGGEEMNRLVAVRASSVVAFAIGKTADIDEAKMRELQSF